MKLDQFLREQIQASTTTTTKIKQKIFEFESLYFRVPNSIKQSVPDEEVDLNLEDFLLVLKRVMAQHKIHSPSKIPLKEHLVEDIGDLSVLQSSFDVLSHSNQSLIIEKDALELEKQSLHEELQQYKNRESENIKEMSKLMSRLQNISQAQYGITGELEDYKQMEKKWLDDINSKHIEITNLQSLLFDHQQAIRNLELEKDEYAQHIQQLQNSLSNFDKLKFDKQILANDNSKLNDEIIELKSQFMQHPFTSTHLMTYVDFKNCRVDEIPKEHHYQILKNVQIGIISEIDRFNNTISSLNTELAQISNENMQLKQAIEKLENEKQQLENELELQPIKLNELQQMLDKQEPLKTENLILNQQIVGLTEKLQKITDRYNSEKTDQATMKYKLQQEFTDFDRQVNDLKAKKSDIQANIKEKQNYLYKLENSIVKSNKIRNTSNWALGLGIVLILAVVTFYLSRFIEFDDKWISWIEYHMSKFQFKNAIIL
eukprot:NODE_304_length_11385_cov_0.300018.p1 type:complete len:487 gc:universal NODE_304_length_11385_cov_0.300018:475-1935(+)